MTAGSRLYSHAKKLIYWAKIIDVCIKCEFLLMIYLKTKQLLVFNKSNLIICLCLSHAANLYPDPMSRVIVCLSLFLQGQRTAPDDRKKLGCTTELGGMFTQFVWGWKHVICEFDRGTWSWRNLSVQFFRLEWMSALGFELISYYGLCLLYRIFFMQSGKKLSVM
jgi:hypothetical protein